MADKREQILARILAIADALKTADAIFATVKRNAMLTDQEQKPAFVLLDGSEDSKNDSAGKGRPGMVTQINIMRPEVYILSKEPRPTGNLPNLQDGPENVGSIINGLRVRFMNALTADATLRTLIGSNGEIVLTTTETDLVAGGAMLGTMKLQFAIAYVFDPTATP